MNGKSATLRKFFALTIATIGAIMLLVALLAAAVQMVVLLSGVSLIIIAAAIFLRPSRDG